MAEEQHDSEIETPETQSEQHVEQQDADEQTGSTSGAESGDNGGTTTEVDLTEAVSASSDADRDTDISPAIDGESIVLSPETTGDEPGNSEPPPSPESADGSPLAE